MRIVILTVQAPYVSGGAEYLAESLRDQFRQRGLDAEIVAVPFKWYPLSTLVEHMMACRLIRLEAANPDVVIALKFPAYLAPWPGKRLWLLHQFRQVYELWGTPYQDIPDTPEGRGVRDMVLLADNTYLREARRIFTNSRIVANRLKTYNGIEADGVLYPPLSDPSIYRPGDFGPYFFYPSRLVTAKRQSLAIEAMRWTRGDFQLLLAGKADTDSYERGLAALIDRYGLEDRVKLLGRVSETQKVELMANACAVLYVPFDEDSYGYVTLEAFHSGKPVITCSDSGGTTELIEHEVNGLVIDPTPESLAQAMDRLWAGRARTRELGRNAAESLRKHNICWDHVVERLLS